MKILIADDNSDDRRYLRASLEKCGCGIAEARDGLEGLEIARYFKPDIIVSDALMPNMDGFQFLKALKSDPALKHIPFIFYSSVYTGYKEEELAKSLGAEAFIVKPREPEEFWNDLLRIIESCRSKGSDSAVATLIREEEEFLRMYSDIVARKLEEKVAELDMACRELKKRSENAEILANQWQRTFDAVSEAVWIADIDGVILQINRAAAEFLGMRPHEAIGQKCCDVVHEMAEPIEDCPLIRAGKTGNPQTLNLKLKDRYVDITVDPIVDDKGVIQSFVHSLRDITERVKAEEERRSLEAQLLHAQKMEAIGRLAGGVAHDFNNILSAIMGYAELSKMQLKDNEPVVRNIDCILEGSAKAANMIRSLLAFSRKQMMEMKPENLNDIIVRMHSFLSRIIGEDVALRVDLSDQPIYVTADRGQIEQVLLNLATNARDAMPDGGIMLIRTESIDWDEDHVRLCGYGSPGAYALLSVADTGIGIDSEIKERIFEPFFSTKEVGKGSGLGLSMVYGIISQHNGFIDVYSEPGQGSEFRIYLPLAEAGVAKEELIEDNITLEGDETILIAEDNEALRNLVVKIFSSFGYKVIEASDGDDAIRKFIDHKNSIDLCFFDMIMPGKGGAEAYREIEKIKPDTRILFTSGYNAEMINRKGLVEDDESFIHKPFNIKQLLKKVRKTLDA